MKTSILANVFLTLTCVGVSTSALAANPLSNFVGTYTPIRCATQNNGNPYEGIRFSLTNDKMIVEDLDKGKVAYVTPVPLVSSGSTRVSISGDSRQATLELSLIANIVPQPHYTNDTRTEVTNTWVTISFEQTSEGVHYFKSVHQIWRWAGDTKPYQEKSYNVDCLLAKTK